MLIVPAVAQRNGIVHQVLSLPAVHLAASGRHLGLAMPVATNHSRWHCAMTS